jgi:hypothetical protein
VLRPVRGFMRQRCIEALSVAESFKHRHLDVIAVVAVEGAVAAGWRVDLQLHFRSCPPASFSVKREWLRRRRPL